MLIVQPRFKEIKRILKNDGIIVVHADPKISHYVRMALDNFTYFSIHSTPLLSRGLAYLFQHFCFRTP